MGGTLKGTLLYSSFILFLCDPDQLALHRSLGMHAVFQVPRSIEAMNARNLPCNGDLFIRGHCFTIPCERSYKIIRNAPRLVSLDSERSRLVWVDARRDRAKEERKKKGDLSLAKIADHSACGTNESRRKKKRKASFFFLVELSRLVFFYKKKKIKN